MTAHLFQYLVIKAIRLKNDNSGVTALEYGIIASILGLTLVTIFKGFGSTLSRLFSSVGTAI